MTDASTNPDLNPDRSNETQNDFQENIQERFEQLQSSFDQLNSQLITIRENVQKRKRETAALKILLYTGLLLLLVGFIYSNTTLQRVQLQNLQEDFRTLTSQTNQNLSAVQKIVLEEMQQMKMHLQRTSKGRRNEKTLRDALNHAKRAVSQFQSSSPQTKELIKQFNQRSNDLLLAYVNYKKSFPGPALPEEKRDSK